MSSQFSTLMALSAMQTQQSQAAVQSTLADRKRKEEQRRKEQEARDKKERELEAKLRLKHFEDEKREIERQKRKEAERAAKEAEKERREAEVRDRLLYGPKKVTSGSQKSGSGYPSVSGATRDELRKNRYPSDDEDGGTVLTRQEKRERKLQNDLKFGAARSKRSAQLGAYQKSGRRLPGGAVDITGDNSSQSPNSSQSVKARLAAMPNTLTRLNVVKRDTRTIDEILRDREKTKEGKTLNGEQAKEFHDWFGKEKKKPPVKAETSIPDSRSNTPSSSTSASKPLTNGSSAMPKKPLPSFNRDSKTSKPSMRSAPSDSKFPKSKPPVAGSKVGSSKSSYPSSSSRKRQRSDSMSSDSASPPPKRRLPSEEPDNYRAEIWKLFGKNRDQYVSNAVDSDDDDMEADATALEREEMRSARIARKEDEEALRLERMHEDEKRRKKERR